MTTLPVLHPVVNLYADEWRAREVAQFAVYAMRQPGGIGHINGLSVFAYHPWTRNGQRNYNARVWTIEDAQGHLLAEEPSLYKAIHKLAK